jgi:hypothetical protein
VIDGEERRGAWAFNSGDSGAPSMGWGGLFLGSLGTWVPFVPRSVSMRLAAQDAVASALGVAYAPPGQAAGDFSVRADVDNDHVRVKLVDRAEAAHTLPPLLKAIFA